MLDGSSNSIPVYTDGNNTYNLHYVVESYINGTNWYRLYNDGWLEQGGYIDNNPDYTWVTFLKEFANTNYTVQATAKQNSGFTPTAWIIDTGQTTGINIAAQRWTNASYTSQVASFYWEARGYAA